jgi:hypothetical protein
MAAVADTSSIILLAKIGRLALLHEHYGQVHIPPAVVAELRAKPDAASQEVERFLGSPGCVRAPQNTLLVQALSADLGIGEAEAIALAVEIPDGLLVASVLALFFTKDGSIGWPFIERIARFLTQDLAGRRQLEDTCRAFDEIRSGFVHGQRISN